jgi:hypothetical protein
VTESADHARPAAAPYTLLQPDGRGGSRQQPSHLSQTLTTITPGGYRLLQSVPLPARHVILADVPPDLTEIGYHRPPQRQLVVVLRGTMQVETSDGTATTMRPGDLVLAADHDGRGHITRFLTSSCRLLIIPLGDPG